MPPMKQRISFDRTVQKRGSGIICLECDVRNHYAPDCGLPLRHQTRVIQNYEQLTTAEKYLLLQHRIIAYAQS